VRITSIESRITQTGYLLPDYDFGLIQFHETCAGERSGDHSWRTWCAAGGGISLPEFTAENGNRTIRAPGRHRSRGGRYTAPTGSRPTAGVAPTSDRCRPGQWPQRSQGRGAGLRDSQPTGVAIAATPPLHDDLGLRDCAPDFDDHTDVCSSRKTTKVRIALDAMVEGGRETAGANGRGTVGRRLARSPAARIRSAHTASPDPPAYCAHVFK
jgi:hypothetical protein